MAIERGAAGGIPGPERPHVLLVQAVDITPDLQPPGLQRVGGEAELAERDAHLDRPAEGVHAGGGLPDRVPRRIAVELVAPDARGVHLEPRVVQVVVVRVEPDDQLVGGQRVERAVVAARVQQLVATGQRRHHAARLGHPRTDIERPIVVEHPHLRGERRGVALVRLVLPQPRGGRGSLPGRFVEPAVQYDGTLERRRGSGRQPGGVRRIGRLGPCGSR